MNKVFIIGNLTNDPERRTTPDGVPVTIFTVAVNRRGGARAQEAEFYRVSAWRGLSESCATFLAKGRKVAVLGELHLNTYEKDGKTRASLEVNASEVEFLSPRETPVESPKNAVKTDAQSGFVQVNVEDELPF